jgi:hypothetical protein
MNCRKHWNQKFLVTNLNKSFVTKDFKEHRQILLCDREISKLPETMELAAKYKQKKLLQNQVDSISLQIKNIDIERNKLLENKYNLEFQIRQVNSTNTKDRRQFIMACSNEDCRGFLNTNYKCEICNLFTCSKCLEIIGPSKNDEHKCDENSIESAKLIKKDTKPCPSCGTRISKISGCDQMWCPECKNAFSWNTGKIENGVIHNPHFFEYQRNNNSQKRNNNQNGLNMCNTDNIPEFYLFNRIVLRPLKQIKETEIYDAVSNLYRLISHISRVEITKLDYQIENYSNTDALRVEYIHKEINKEEMTKAVYLKDKNRRKMTEILQVYDLIRNVGKDILNGILNLNYNTNDEFISVVLEQINVFNNLKEYCNNQFKIISASYSCVTPLLNNFEIETQKHNISALIKEKNNKISTASSSTASSSAASSSTAIYIYNNM